MNSEALPSASPSAAKERVETYKHILAKEKAAGGLGIASTGTMSTAASIVSKASLKLGGGADNDDATVNSSLSKTSQTKAGLLDLMQQCGDATEDLGDALPAWIRRRILLLRCCPCR